MRWSHQIVRADSTCARGKAAREFFSRGVILLFYFLSIQFSYSREWRKFEIGLATVARLVDNCMFIECRRVYT
jgi:hypothetical protein